MLEKWKIIECNFIKSNHEQFHVLQQMMFADKFKQILNWVYGGPEGDVNRDDKVCIFIASELRT